MKNAMLMVLLWNAFGCASVSEKEAQVLGLVKVTDLGFLNSPNNCKKVGAVQGDSVGASGGQSAAMARMKVSAHKLGGNVVASNMVFTPTLGLLAPAEKVSGHALSCSSEAFAKITSIDEIANNP